MKIIDGKGAVLGRLASYVAKESLKGEEIAVVNCDEIIITGTKANEGVGRNAFKKIKCYREIPKEFESAKKIEIKDEKRKFIKISEVSTN